MPTSIQSYFYKNFGFSKKLEKPKIQIAPKCQNQRCLIKIYNFNAYEDAT